MLRTEKLSAVDISALQQVIKRSNEVFTAVEGPHQDAINLIVDSGCSFSCTNDARDIVTGTLETLPEPVILGGIAGGVEVKQKGIAKWETVDQFPWQHSTH